MVRIRLDPQGTLLALQAQPLTNDKLETRNLKLETSHWAEPLLREANLSPSTLTPTAPKGPLPVYANSRIAYSATLHGQPIHIEAAEYNGRPVYFSISGPAGEERFQSVRTQRQIGVGINVYVWTIMSLGLILVGTVLAWRNYHSGRSDRSGAMRLAFTFTILGTIAWLLRAHHVSDLFQEYPQFQRGVGANLYRVCVVWIFYLALEPYVRRVWPEIVISWNRIITGKFFDPLVGRDILIGSTAGAITMVLHAIDMLIPRWLNFPAPMPDRVHATRMLASLGNFAALFSGALSAIFVALGLLLLIVILRMLLPTLTLRNKIIASTVFILFVVAGTARIEGIPPTNELPFFAAILDYLSHLDYLSLILQTIIAAIFLFILINHGLVALFFCLLIRSLLLDFPITHDFSVWYAKATIIPLLCITLILTTALYAALGGRSPITFRSP